ncbi:protein phosphatase 2C domain-containing protein [bacterium]|nr:protein phosphatase 2C domain-containing protein [bacterium]
MEDKKPKKPSFRTYGLTDVGVKRPANEDVFLINEKYGLFIVADGMGGHAGGEIASNLTVKTINDFIQAAFQPLDIEYDSEETLKYHEAIHLPKNELFKRAIRRANVEVFRENEKRKEELARDIPELKGPMAAKFKKRGRMGTTLIACLVREDKMFIANVGDSRLYRIRDNVMQQLTVDQSFLEEKVQSGQISEEEVQFEKRNRITGCIGINERVYVDVEEITVRVGDRYILCTDGLSDGLVKPGMLDRAETEAKKNNFEKVCKNLIKLSIEGGSKDNITVIVFDIVDLGVEPPGKKDDDEEADDEESLMPFKINK